MKNQPTSAMIAGVMSGIAAACVCLAIVFALQSRSLQRQLEDGRRLWSEAVAHTADLRVQQASMSSDLTAHRQRLAELRQEIASLEAKAGGNVTVSERPVPVRIYDGPRLVGAGWIPASATNRSGMAGDGVATVFLDRRGALAAPADNDHAPQAVSASPGVASVSTSSFVYQQYPYYWPAVWWGGDPGPPPDPEAPSDPQPRPGPPSAPEVQPRTTPTQHLATRSAPQMVRGFSPPAPRLAPFPPPTPLTPVITPPRTRAVASAVDSPRGVSPLRAGGVNASQARSPLRFTPTGR